MKRCCRNCLHCDVLKETCNEGGFTEIGNIDIERSEEDCSAWVAKGIYSNSVMSRCRQRLWLEHEDTSKDNIIMEMSKRDVLDECLQWEGIIGYRDLIITWINDIYGIDFEKV